VFSQITDKPTNSILWNGASGIKMLDTDNKKRFSILGQKYAKLKARNMVIQSAGATAQTTGSKWTEGTAET